jgi:hypothetical protein
MKSPFAMLMNNSFPFFPLSMYQWYKILAFN